MKKHLIVCLLMLISIICIYNTGYSQSIYKIQENRDVDMKIVGTSSLHDWEMDTRSSTGEAEFIFKPGSNNALDSIKSLSFALQVIDLKSNNNGLDNNAYEALKSEKYKEICYNLTSSTLSVEKEGYLIKSTGMLIVAGISKEIKMTVHASVHEDGTISFNGSYQLDMTDYNVEPPSFMWGAMKTGDVLTLDFSVIFQKS